MSPSIRLPILSTKVKYVNDVEKGTAIYITFVLDKLIKFKPLKIDVSKFEKEESSGTPNLTYRNKDLGISYGIYMEGWEEPELLTDVSIFPSKSFA